MAPTVVRSDLPGLLGLHALKRNRAVLDVNTNKLYFLGPGDYDLDKAVPPGTDIIQCEVSPSGHIILPCCEYDAPDAAEPPRTVSLHTNRVEDSGMGSPEAVPQHNGSIPAPPVGRPKRVRFGDSVPPVPPPPQHYPSV